MGKLSRILFVAFLLVILLYLLLLNTNTKLSINNKQLKRIYPEEINFRTSPTPARTSNTYYEKSKVKNPEQIKVQKTTRNKTILYWNIFWRFTDFKIGLGSEIFQHCEYKNCYMTNKKKYLPIDQFDAVIFHGYNYRKSGDKKPKKRDPKQMYIFYVMESPQNLPIQYKLLHNFYNWTMTYRKDSDIYRPHNYYLRENVTYTAPTMEDVRNKTKKIAWLVSNCRAFSHRNELVEELSKYFPIDIYGKCGSLSCPKAKSDLCYKMIERDYKFYLSLENSICTDYITEKTFNLLDRNIIPIVMGGANYSAITPPHSVINVQDFKHINDLVKYLEFLDANPEEYLKYFEWKTSYKKKLGAELAVCELCKKLNEEHETKVYSSISDWWLYKNKTTPIRHCTSSFVDNFIS